MEEREAEKAGRKLAHVVTTTQFADEVEARSRKAGVIVDRCMGVIDKMVENFAADPKEAGIDARAFLRLTEMLMRFYKDTQRTLESRAIVQQTFDAADGKIAELMGGATLQELPDEKLVELARLLKRQEANEVEARVIDAEADRTKELAKLGRDIERRKRRMGAGLGRGAGEDTAEEGAAELPRSEAVPASHDGE